MKATSKSPDSRPTIQTKRRRKQKFTGSSRVAKTSESRCQKTPPRLTLQHHAVNNKAGYREIRQPISPHSQASCIDVGPDAPTEEDQNFNNGIGVAKAEESQHRKISPIRNTPKSRCPHQGTTTSTPWADAPTEEY